MKKWNIINKLKNNGAEKDIVKILLANRGIKTKKDIEEFINPKLTSVTLESVGIDKKEVKKTIVRIEKAIKKNETIVIYGDYDVDGICGTAILWETIYGFYKNVTPYIPHRVEEGYGLSIKGIENLKNKNCRLIITVDNGIVAYDAIEYAKKEGIDIIVTDHHLPSKKELNAYAVVHTTQLCGTSVAYLLSREISKDRSLESSELNHLDLVALATVADMVPLLDANRALLKFGLDSLRETRRVGLLSLFSASGIEKEKIGTYEIGYIIAPRLNAAGRMEHAIDGLRLICTTDKNRAAILAKKLNETNKDRQILTEEMRLHAEEISEKISTSEKIIFVYDKSYNQGVVGLVASRLVEKHYRPSFVVSVGEKLSKGSARSIKGCNIIEFIRKFQHFLIDTGGHPMAAGFTIETSKIEIFKKALEEHGKEIIKDEQLIKSLDIDLEFNFNQITFEMFESIQKLLPFGMKNPEPVFLTKNVTVSDIKTVGKDGKHLKLLLEKNGKKILGIWFGNGKNDMKIGKEVDVVYTIDSNYWNGESKLQLKIKDVGKT
ncbi:MAG: single-stranded-DNA-specific exonuclease RecJ [Candidatus Levybacteria bacterium CG_4_10_14_0_2_um_filter_36_16]|nr:MAG: single-stranded-DNA-specific exonuclease RecJ [Candidatus Levybacteria bacterium CG2_30_37_29]PIZ97541.1 MAG: single-stranded-DNA-specific exonuclease RecJ [Candidatus Levybacteria bacterium CG_4_10_14_0_2_um_filter_36_16]